VDGRGVIQMHKALTEQNLQLSAKMFNVKISRFENVENQVLWLDLIIILAEKMINVRIA
jgi:hypothetical protein